jgi:hypothetical protein
MPLYRYENEEGDVLYVLRTMDEYKIPPTDEEIAQAGKKPGKWERKLEPPRTTGKESWRTKGYH